MIPLKKWLHTAFFFLIACHFSILQADNNRVQFKHLTIDDGLSQSSIFAVCQDQKGFMWIATEAGVNRYDGYDFHIYESNPLDIQSLSNNWIYTIIEDHLGKIWVGTEEGLNRFNREKETFERLFSVAGDDTSLSHNKIYVVHEDHLGYVWVGTDNGLNRFDRESNTFRRFWLQPDNDQRDNFNRIRAIHEDGFGSLWIGTDGGLFRIPVVNPENEQPVLYQHNPRVPQSLSDNQVLAIYEDKSQNLWIGTANGGLNHYNRENDGFEHFRHNPRDPNSLSDDHINVIYEDKLGALWLGTQEGGLNRFDREHEEFLSFLNNPYDPNSLNSNRVFSLMEDNSGILWVGTYGGGVSMTDLNAKKFRHINHDPNITTSLSHPFVRAFLEDKNGVLWVGTDGGGLNRYDPEQDSFLHYRFNPNNPRSLSNDRVFYIHEDSVGILWIGTYGGGLNRFDTRTGTFSQYRYSANDNNSLSDNRVRVIQADPHTNVMWIGTDGGGINKFDPEKNSFHRFMPDLNNPNSISHGRIFSMRVDPEGILWIPTFGGGLNRFDTKTETFTQYKPDPDNPKSISSEFLMTVLASASGIVWLGSNGGGLIKFDQEKGEFSSYAKAEGLAGNAIYGILEDEAGNLWLSTNNGLSKFNPQTATFKNYDVHDGLQSKEYNGGSFYKNRQGEMFFGGINGFNRFMPAEIQDNPIIPPVVITDFKIFNQSVSIGDGNESSEFLLEKSIAETDSIKISYREDAFSFEFAALHFVYPDKNQFAYMMEGFDKDWIYTVAKKRFANYTNLDPGKYTFRVKASNNDGLWNEEGIALDIRITPPFWETLWFRIIAAILLISLVGLAFALRIRNLEAKQRKLQALVDEQTKDLKDKTIALEAEVNVRKQAEKEAQIAKDSAEAANQAKSMFLARMSHEIRTPMNSVLGFSDMLLDTNMTEEQTEFTRTIAKSGEALLSLINEILDFSKIEAGEMTFEKLDFDLEITAFDVCHLVRPRLENRPVEILCRIGDDIPAYIRSDPGRIRQVLLNLMANAAKFTHEGEIELCLDVEEEEEDKIKLHFSIRDTGIGIPGEKKQAIFEAFQQADGSTTRKYGGTGLGLAICKQIAKYLDGDIWVESELDKGSTFHFTGWVDKSTKTLERAPYVDMLAGKKILIVDDNLNNLNILSHFLTQSKIRCHTLTKGKDVIPYMEKELESGDPFDLCVLDIQMPRMSGYEVAKQVRQQQNQQIANIPLLAFSSSVSKRSKVSREVGFDGFLPKPIQRSSFLKMIKRLLGEEEKAAQEREKDPIITQHTLKEEAKHTLTILLAEDNLVNQKLALFMLNKAGYKVEIANNGQEAVDKLLSDPDKYNLIFMDVNMPEMDGLEATRKIRELGYKQIPIIAMTAAAMQEDRDMCLESGMNDYIPKPIKREIVFSMVEKYVMKK